MMNSELLLAARPGVASGRMAKQWLKQLPLSDAGSAHHAATAMIAELVDADVAPGVRLEVLETVRASIAEIGAQFARGYADKPLPLGPVERNAFERAQSLRRTLAMVYLGCFESSLDVAPELATHRALCLARAAACYCDALKGRMRSGQGGIGEEIGKLQTLVDMAVEHEVFETRVRDSLVACGATSVSLTYNRALLLALAGSAAAGREREAMFDLAQCWEGKIECTVEQRRASRDAGVATRPASAINERVPRLRTIPFGRWLHTVDIAPLSRSIGRRLRRLDRGEALAGLGLPATFRAVEARNVLARALKVWCDRADMRAVQRVSVAAAGAKAQARSLALAYAGADFEAMYLMIAGEAFSLNQEDATSRRRFDELFVFQQASGAREEARAREAARLFEDWEICDESAVGLGLRRLRAGARFRVDQLVAMRLWKPGDHGPVALARLRWLSEPDVGADGGAPGALEAGVELFEGKPHAVGIRVAGVHGGAPYCASFRLGPLHARASVRLLVPCGRFGVGRQIEIHDAGSVYRLRVAVCMSRGCDFEQIEAQMTA